jgi:tRNA delta(2)-isopentenylpyrophosphate transferase
MRNFKIIKIGINIKKENLHVLIDNRVDFMVRKGLFNEVKNLIKYEKKNALNTVGYKEVFQFFKNIKTKKEVINEIKINTKKYAKRQITWFKRDLDIKWFNLDFDEIFYFINKKINNY